MNAIRFVVRTGCHWNALKATGLGSSSSAHRRFREWTAAGVFLAFWREGVFASDGLQGVAKDDVAAYSWYSLAAAQGDDRARTALQGMKKVMTTKQKAEAQQRVQELNSTERSE